MKRNIKNIIMICLIIIMVIGNYLVMNNIKNNVSVNNEFSIKHGDNKELKENNKKEKNNSATTKKSKKEKNKENKEEKNNGDIKVNNLEENTPPNMEMGTPPSMPLDMNEKENNISKVYYVIFGINSFVIALTIMYLIMSRMNKKTFKETFMDKDKIVITGLCSLILTALLTYFSIYLTNSYFVNNKVKGSNITNDSKNSSGNNSKNISYTSSKEITENDTITSGTFTSSNEDENAISISGDIDVTLSDIEVSKEGDSEGGDNTSFYGTNSAIIAKDGANVTIKNIKVTTEANGANGVFSYGGSATTNNEKSDGTTVNISDSVITTTKNNSGGIMTTGGGFMNAKNLTITTDGQSSAAIRSDRGGGTVNVEGGSYTSNGVGSPAIYSTADITVKDATLTSTTSEGIIIEGKNSVTLDNVTLVDTHTKNVKSKTYKNIFIYQSMSGDAKEGTAEFTSKNSKITTNHGDSFYVTNTTAIINLENNEIINNDSEGYFLRIGADSWGTEGKNGGIVTLNMTNQKVNGNISVDNISSLSMKITKESYFEGSINKDNTAKEINLTIDSTSTIKLTSDSYVTSLNDSDLTYSNIDFNGYKLYVNGKSIN